MSKNRLEWRAGVCKHLRAERQVGDEVPIHDVEVYPLGAGLFDSLEFAGELAEIPRKNGRRNNHARHNLRSNRPIGKILTLQHGA